MGNDMAMHRHVLPRLRAMQMALQNNEHLTLLDDEQDDDEDDDLRAVIQVPEERIIPIASAPSFATISQSFFGSGSSSSSSSGFSRESEQRSSSSSSSFHESEHRSSSSSSAPVRQHHYEENEFTQILRLAINSIEHLISFSILPVLNMKDPFAAQELNQLAKVLAATLAEKDIGPQRVLLPIQIRRKHWIALSIVIEAGRIKTVDYFNTRESKNNNFRRLIGEMMLNRGFGEVIIQKPQYPQQPAPNNDSGPVLIDVLVNFLSERNNMPESLLQADVDTIRARQMELIEVAPPSLASRPLS